MVVLSVHQQQSLNQMPLYYQALSPMPYVMEIRMEQLIYLLQEESLDIHICGVIHLNQKI